MKEMNGKQLSDIRERLGWTQETLAGFLGLHRVHISRMENGTKAIDRRAALALLYHVDACGLGTCKTADMLYHYTRNHTA